MDMEIILALILMAMLIAGSLFGLFVQSRLKEHHRSPASSEAIRLVVLMLVTLAALILGLLVTSVKADFDNHDDLYRQYGIALIRLDIRLREFGPEATPIRKTLRAYTAMAILQSWPDEAAPSGTYPTQFTPLFRGSGETKQITAALRSIDEAIQTLNPVTPYQTRIYPILRENLTTLENVRWILVEGASSRVSSVFMTALMFWLLIVFFMFGIVAPRNSLIYLSIILASLSVASTLFIILDLDSPMDGVIKISSAPLRDALLHMDQPPAP
ncbi:hypothetical protein ACELLULO517_06295 [Acidisoma cellulosilytica]|uniref:DUF4239 domain-containing protein n=1 Tax=Acidisoma cellulosilyticum TaxID=2802395 RepID=A0A963Z0M7_9PROT|nr:hypothetical protein [Acidisoma cellulosilyticum]MCB8879837.1 hypothetical protein [Acidisoma cellulosilyticum]